VDEHHVAGGAFDQGGDRGLVQRPGDEVPFLTVLLWLAKPGYRLSRPAQPMDSGGTRRPGLGSGYYSLSRKNPMSEEALKNVVLVHGGFVDGSGGFTEEGS
jgi:hypothetical protein